MRAAARQLHGMWAAVRRVVGASTRTTSTRAARRVTERMLERVARRSRASACSSSRAARAASGWPPRALVAPGGEVVLSDVAAEMTAIAARAGRRARARQRAARASSTSSSIDEPDASYDVVLCREGLMFVPDPARGAREIRRVLRPGGRVAIAVWGPRERNPWLGARVRRGQRADRHAGAAARRARPVLARRRRRARRVLLPTPGSRDVAVGELPTPLRAGSFEEWWARTSALAGPLASILASLPEPAHGRAPDRRLREAVASTRRRRGSRSPGLTLIASAAPVSAAVVLGARNLGAAITRDLLAHGVRVACVARTPADLDLSSRPTARWRSSADAADPEPSGAPGYSSAVRNGVRSSGSASSISLVKIRSDRL